VAEHGAPYDEEERGLPRDASYDVGTGRGDPSARSVGRLLRVDDPEATSGEVQAVVDAALDFCDAFKVEPEARK